ncbi:hypothetical protein JXB22_11105, partial [candidate division WOR-3 bacterium]|nr:hypothetical protein [candidate division WOR-3 bacterium]
MVFKTAKLDTVAIVVTIIVTALIVGLGILFIVKVPYGWIWAMAMLLIPGISYALSPKTYRYDGASIIIEKVAGRTITIPIKDIKGYTVIENLSRMRMTRTFGNGGLFGYYGMFSTAEYGPINCQLTAMKNVVLIKTNTVLYAVSPDNIDGFVSVLGAPGEPVQPIAPDDVRQASPWILILPIGLYAATIIVLV